MSCHKMKDGRWFAKWQEKGKERRKYFGYGDLEELTARKWDECHKAAKAPKPAESGITVADLLMRYHTDHLAADSTRQSDLYRLRGSLIPLLGKYGAEQLTTKNLSDYVTLRLGEKKKRSTVARELDIIKAAYGWGEDQDPQIVHNNPVRRFRIADSRKHSVPMPPTREEIAAILRHIRPHARRAVILLWCCGLRPGGEVARIMWSDVDLAGKKIRIESARKRGPAIRYVPIGEGSCDARGNYVPCQLERHLAEWRSEDEQSLKKGEDLSSLPLVRWGGKAARDLKHAWAYAKKKAKITRRLRFYDLRHAFATYVLEAGADLKATSEIIGHSRPDTTLRVYQHILTGGHRKVVAHVPEIPFAAAQTKQKRPYHDSITTRRATRKKS